MPEPKAPASQGRSPVMLVGVIVALAAVAAALYFALAK
jgi:hypothetical protein